MKFDELSNDEIIFIYLSITEIFDEYNDTIKDEGITYIVDSPLGKVSLFKALSDAELSKLVNSKKFKLLNSINNKLAPIVDIIEDANPDIISAIKKVIRPIDNEENN